MVTLEEVLVQDNMKGIHDCLRSFYMVNLTSDTVYGVRGGNWEYNALVIYVVDQDITPEKNASTKPFLSLFNLMCTIGFGA